MANTTQDIELREGSRREPASGRFASVRTVLVGSGAVATVAGAAVLAFVTLRGADENKPVGQPLIAEHGSIRANEGAVEDSAGGDANRPFGHPLLAEHGSIRASEGAVEDSAGLTGHGASDCLWTTEVNVPVFPAEDLGGPPTPQSVLVFERCNGEWTGQIAWLNPPH
jgi:hypothetical protein